ncbi:MAG: cytochrome b [Casimicrobiaceae bacterium]
MSGSEPAIRYTTTAIVLHWVIALAVIAQIIFGWWMQEIPKLPVGPRVNAFNLHKSIGMSILLLMVMRLTWRATHPPPELPAMPAWQLHAAHMHHWLLYACLFVQPATGYLGSIFSGYPVRFYGVVLPAWAARNDAMKDLMSSVHLVMSWILVAAIVIHVLAALKHHVIDRDGLLRRMWVRGAA